MEIGEKGALIKARDAFSEFLRVVDEDSKVKWYGNNFDVYDCEVALAALNEFIDEAERKIGDKGALMDILDVPSNRSCLDRSAAHLHNGIKGKDND